MWPRVLALLLAAGPERCGAASLIGRRAPRGPRFQTPSAAAASSPWADTVRPVALASASPHSAPSWAKPSWKYRILLPKAKLAFCYIPKVASEQLSGLFNEINGLAEPAAGSAAAKGGGGRSNSSVGRILQLAYSSAQGMGIRWHTVTRERGYRFALFLRDPLERYLSAFGDRCIFKSEHPKGSGSYMEEFWAQKLSCLGDMVEEPASLEAKVRAFEGRVRLDAARAEVGQNEHWRPQKEIIEVCGWDQFDPAHIDFVGQLQGDVNARVKEMLRFASVLGADASVDRFFPVGRVAGRNSSTHEHFQQFYRDPSVAEAVRKLYKEDYALLKSLEGRGEALR